ncbi:MAG: signal peptide peptidase SppA [Thermodesulfobacteriota bacterium]|nr:signal peptide peptidase SppA [Thermodesulfobacteriota bacterium]
MANRLFRRDHPILLGLIILAGLCLLFLGGITYFFSILSGPAASDHLFSKKTGIGIVELKGLILSPEKIIETISDFRHNPAVKAIVLRVDSPGGAVGASQEIFTELKRANKIKPVVASMGSLAASGGYYAALGAERILASPGTLTGSISVIFKFADLGELFGKIGYKNQVVKSGKLKDVGSSHRPMTEEERRMLQELVDKVHEQFVAAISENRSLPVEEVKRLADGRIISGQQAKALGLVDEFGNFIDAVMLAAKLAGIEDEKPRLIYPQNKDFSLLKLLVGEQNATSLNRVMVDIPFLSYEWTGIQ